MMKVQLEESDIPAAPEPTLQQAVARLAQEAFHNVSLICIDGATVPGNRQALAARSTVFEKMLLGGFQEASQATVNVGYKGSVVDAIVAYVHTDTASILEKSMKTSTGNVSGDGPVNDSVGDEEIKRVQALVTLCGAAVYYGLPCLCRKAFECLSGLLYQWPTLSFVLLEACIQEGPSVPDKLKDLSLSQIYDITAVNGKTVDAKTMALLSPPALEVILSNEKCWAKEFVLFQIVHAWSSVEDEPTASNRKSAASQMIQKWITLELVPPILLSTSVASSGLVPAEQLSETYKKQACMLAAQEGHGVQFQRRRFLPPPVWSTSGSDVFSSTRNARRDVLVYPPLGSGVLRWTCLVEKCSGTVSGTVIVGVVATNTSIDLTKPITSQPEVRAWVYRNDGAFSENQALAGHHAKYEQGSQLTFTLDLSSDNKEKGTLSASVDAGDPFILFSNMKLHLDEHGGGFVPMVSIKGACIRLLEINELKD